MIEIGTSAGYSALWLAQACRVSGQSLTTFEILPEKARLARETFDRTGVTDVIRLVEGDYLDTPTRSGGGVLLPRRRKDVYESCYDVIVPKMVPGAILVADNARATASTCNPFSSAYSPMTGSTPWSPPSARVNSCVADAEAASSMDRSEFARA